MTQTGEDSSAPPTASATSNEDATVPGATEENEGACEEIAEGRIAIEKTELSHEQRVKAEMEASKDMKIGELRLKLQAMGILTNSFCEKSEFVQAYAEAVVKKAEQTEDNVDIDNADNPEAAGSTNDVKEAEWNDDDEDDDDDDEDPIEKLPSCVQHRVKKLKDLHDEREKAMESYLKERAALEAKYHAISKPFYDKRYDIIRGALDDEIENEAPTATDESKESSEKIAGVPQFWVCALGNMEVVAHMISESDVDCLESLIDIRCEDDEDGKGFTLRFIFAKNDYFENSELTKRYEVPNLLTADEPILKNVEGCDIKWKPGKSLTHRSVTKKQRGRGKNSGQLREVTTKQDTESFFHFFQPPKMPSFENMNEEEAERLEREFDQDYDIAQAFRSHIIPKAVLWFTGQVRKTESLVL